ncbi:MAG TPA: hypothetical protein PLV92_22940, partial [Pirellulaceae bacterium]|nr:hypothetical protein [Pirellulaceae bacterium]
GNAAAANNAASGDGWRTWRIVLAQHAADQVRLAIDFQQTLPSSEPKGLPLSLVRADSTQVNYQSGLVAVETAPELDVQLTVDQEGPGRPRKIDVGELAEADYVVGRRVLGAYGFVGGTPTLAADVFRRSALALPEAIVQRAELVTLIGATGRAATAARFLLRSKASFLELQLPEGAKLWSAVLDGQPMAPQRNDRRLLLSIPPKAGETLRDVQVVYEVTLSSLGTRGTIAASAPKLQLREADGETTRDVQLADLSWQVVLPNGYRVTRADGTVFPDWNDASTRGQLAMRPTPWVHLARTSENAATWVGDSLSAAGRSLESLAPSAKFTMLADSSKSVARYTADFDSYAFRRGAQGVDGSMPTPSAPEMPPGAFTGPMGGGGPGGPPNSRFAPAMGGGGGMGGMGGAGFGPGGGGAMGGGGRGPESGPMSGSGGMPGAGAGPGGMPGMPGIGGMPGAVPQSRAPADSRANRPRRTARDAAAETAPSGGEKSEDVGLDVL